MFKRLLINLFALSLTAIWAAAAYAYLPRPYRRGVGYTVYGEATDVGTKFLATIIGLPDNCEVNGALYCADINAVDPEILCQIGFGATRGNIVVDHDSIALNAIVKFADGKEHQLTADEINLSLKDPALRLPLPFFQQAVIDGATDPNKRRLFINVGEPGHEGFWMFQTPNSWCPDNNCDSPLDYAIALAKFMNGDCGFGTKCGKTKASYYLDQAYMEPMTKEDFQALVGEKICTPVTDDNFQLGDGLWGNYLGFFCFQLVEQDFSYYPWVEIEPTGGVDASLPLYETVYGGGSGEGKCLPPTGASVYAPSPADGVFIKGEGTFPAVEGTLSDCTGEVCEGSVEVLLDPIEGQRLCDETHGEGATNYIDFIPINATAGGYDTSSFIGIVRSSTNSNLNSTLIASEPTGGASYYTTAPFNDPLPTCTKFLLTATKAGDGKGTVTSNPIGIDFGKDDWWEYYDEDTNVTLTATADQCSEFTGWSGDVDGNCPGIGTCEVIMDQDRTVTATFVQTTKTLTVTKSDPDNAKYFGAWIKSEPSGIFMKVGDTIDSATYNCDTQVTLTVTKTDDFVQWNGVTCAEGQYSEICTFNMDTDLNIQAEFSSHDP